MKQLNITSTWYDGHSRDEHITTDRYIIFNENIENEYLVLKCDGEVQKESLCTLVDGLENFTWEILEVPEQDFLQIVRSRLHYNLKHVSGIQDRINDVLKEISDTCDQSNRTKDN